MDRLRNAIKWQAGQLDARAGQPRFGIVTSVRAEAALAKVALQPEGIVTGWLPVLTPWLGNGWGISCPPSPGDQVLVLPQEGYAEHGVIVGRAFSDRMKTPAAAVGELWIVHRSGSSIRLTNDGKVHVTGDLIVDGEIHDRHGSIQDFRLTYNAHRHRIHNGTNSDQPVPEVPAA